MLRFANKKQKVYIVFALVLCASLVLAGILLVQDKKTSPGGSTPTINITYDNFVSAISKNSMVKAFPKDEKVLLRFYNFDSGDRAFERSYYVSSGKIEETKDENAEVVVLISSKYMDELTNKNLCSVLKKANQHNDLGIETEISTVSLTWKFRSMMKYKDCF